LKNIVQPTLVLSGLLSLGYGTPVVPEAVLTAAIPTMPLVIVLAVQYRVAEARASATLFLSMVASIFTMGIFIALTR
jgi:malonate transporter and related proteins